MLAVERELQTSPQSLPNRTQRFYLHWLPHECLLKWTGFAVFVTEEKKPRAAADKVCSAKPPSRGCPGMPGSCTGSQQRKERSCSACAPQASQRRWLRLYLPGEKGAVFLILTKLRLHKRATFLYLTQQHLLA